MAFKLPVHCPSCETMLSVSQLSCPECSTVVSGNYDLPLFLQLTRDEQDFIMQFILNSGSLKEMAAQMGNSYPTVRNKLDDIIGKINQLKNKNGKDDD
ncbi:DUF2089 family protein [Sinomicrobium weinanense]|uniref:DUF2089 family protein n=1 Tax=Sinomicrobium weinanense TaxID=2842200 RepID=A0A926Q232_9FLAO|nr:DUF2089 family protein [Sinomicrobium weinanense]MBC9796237.1 DUF2089 family protein [Sinomicrobium weinanense]MBU3122308.1 DUF2089 domain-containing protein [Sinomicrobium weinanense]